MDPSELLSGEQTPTSGSSAASIERRINAENDTDNMAQKLIEKLKEHESDDDSDDDDDSFVTMEEIKDDNDLQAAEAADNELYAKLGSGEMMMAAEPKSKVTFNNGGSNKEGACEPKSFHRLSHRLSRELVRRRSSIMEAMPETPAGWTVLVSALASALLGHELRLQQKLSCPPLVFGQCGPNYDHSLSSPNKHILHSLPLQAIFKKLTETPDSLLSRPIHPSLFVGTRGSMASIAAYALGGPPSTDQHVSFRQVLTMSADGAKIALDWELPPEATPTTTYYSSEEARKDRVKTRGGIHKPVVLVLTGMNNDTSFGYIRSLMRTFTDRDWLAVAMNFRGCGGVPLATPRVYNGGYTGDLRGVVQYLASRLAPNVPLFLVGNSLSANIVTKYLGEEGLSGTLPKAVVGGAALGNPLSMHVSNLSVPWKEILALGVKKDLLLNWPHFRHMTTVPSYRSSIHNVLKARDIGEVDAAFAPIFIRNESHYPFAVKIGFTDAEHYWSDSSSFKYIKHISVPCLQIVASDDVICYKSFQKKLAHCVQNPNVMCIETKCGGHLGWQESPPDSNAFGVGTSWADRATADFFGAILDTGSLHHRPVATKGSQSHGGVDESAPPVQPPSGEHDQESLAGDTPRFRSKL